MTPHEEPPAVEMIAFPPRMGSLATKVGPLTLPQASWIGGSGSMGAAAGYALIESDPGSAGATVAAVVVFLAFLALGLLFGFYRRQEMPLAEYLLRRQRFRSRPRVLLGEATQRLLDLRDLTKETLVLPNDTYVRVVRVEGVNLALQSAEEQEERVGGFLRLLNGLDFPVQVVARPDRFDARPYLRALLDRHDAEPSPLLRRLTEDYLRFFHGATEGTLDRRFYVATSVRLSQVAPHLYEEGAVPSPEERAEAAAEVLDRRVGALLDDLLSLGLGAEVVAGSALVDLLRSYTHFGQEANEGPKGAVASVLELLRPSRVVLHPDHLQVGSEFVRVLQVHDYPAKLPPGWLTPLLTLPSRVDVTLHIDPVGQELAMTMLRQEVVRLEVERLGKLEKGSADTLAVEHHLEVFDGIRAALTRQDERLFRTGLYLSLRADSREALDALTAQVQGRLRGRMVRARVPVFRQERGLRSTLPLGRDLLDSGYPLQGSAVATMFPFVSALVAHEEGVLYGFSEVNGTPVLFDRFSCENFNTCIFGASGSGKSYALKSELLRLMILRPTLRAFVIDPLGEFGDLARSLEGAVLRVGPQEGTYLNPLWVGASPGERAERAKGFFEVLMDLTPEERALLDGVLSRMYRERREEFLLSDLAKELAKAGSAHADRLVLLLEPCLTGSYAFLDHPTTVDLSARFVTFDLSSLRAQGRAMLVPVMSVVLDFIAARCAEDMEPKVLAVDEAWYLMGRPESARTLSDLARHSRHSKTGLTLISQTAEDFLSDERGRVILANSCITTLFRHKVVSGAMREHFGLTRAEVDLVRFARTGKETGYSTALFITGTARTPLRVQAADFEHWLITSDPDEVKAKVASAGLEGTTPAERDHDGYPSYFASGFGVIGGAEEGLGAA